MAPMKIFGITGPARSGKDTLAGAILRQAVRGERMSFAAPIRSFVASLLDIAVDQLEDSPIKEAPQADFGGKSPRHMMQTLGTEWGRELIDEHLWITVARRKLERLASMQPTTRPDVVVFSDVRFDNEAAMIRESGGTIIRLARPGTVPVRPHASEHGISHSYADVALLNDGGITKLSRLALDLLSGR